MMQKKFTRVQVYSLPLCTSRYIFDNVLANDRCVVIRRAVVKPLRQPTVQARQLLTY